MDLIYGFCRVSTKRQNIERQVRNILEKYPNAYIVKEYYTGTKLEGRKEWIKLYNLVKKEAEEKKRREEEMRRKAEEERKQQERMKQEQERMRREQEEKLAIQKREQEEQERIKKEQAERIRREQEELRRKEEHSKLPETPIIEEPKVEKHVLEAPVQTPMFEPKEDIQITEKEPKKELEHEITEDEFFDDFFSDDDDE